MNHKKKVSIVSTIYNKEKYLVRYFESVLNQSYKNLEIVCVDNGSTDKTLSIVEEYAFKDNRIKAVKVINNQGPSDGYRHAFSNATGDYVTVVDADDFIDKDYISTLVEAIESCDADVAMCVNDMVYPDGRVFHKEWPKEEKHIIDGVNTKYLLHQMFDEKSNKYFGFYMPEIGGVWNKMYKRDLLVKNEINYETQYWKWCDFVFNALVMKHVEKIVYINTTVYHFFQSDDSVTRARTFDKTNFSLQFLAVNRLLKEIKEIKTPHIKDAFLVFSLRVIKDFYRYYSGYYNSGEITENNFKDGMELLNKQSFFKFSYLKLLLSNLNREDKIMILAMRQRNVNLYKKYVNSELLPQKIKNYFCKLIR